MTYKSIPNVQVKSKFIRELLETSIEYCAPKNADIIDVKITHQPNDMYPIILTYFYRKPK